MRLQQHVWQPQPQQHQLLQCGLRLPPLQHWHLRAGAKHQQQLWQRMTQQHSSQLQPQRRQVQHLRRLQWCRCPLGSRALCSVQLSPPKCLRPLHTHMRPVQCIRLLQGVLLLRRLHRRQRLALAAQPLKSGQQQSLLPLHLHHHQQQHQQQHQWQQR